ncbi:MAG: LysR family transcriptional regulator [Pseudomonadota bacterium]
MSVRWNDIEIFLAVAEKKSLSQAAEQLRLSVPTVMRRIDALEAELGVSLVRKTTRGTLLTEAGKTALDDARAGARNLSQFARVAQGFSHDVVRVPIRISSTEPMVSGVLAPRLPDLLDVFPDARIEFDVDTGLSDLTWGDVDIAVRLAQPRVESYVGRRLKRIELALFCSRRYLRRRNPDRLNLADEKFIWLDAKYQGIPENRWLEKNGLAACTVMRSSSIRALEQACLAGVGIAPLPRFSAPAKLVEVSGPALPPRQPWIVFHKSTRRDKRMRLVRDWIAAACDAAF